MVDIGEEVEGWPKVGRGHRWINVLAAAQWGETEKIELQEVMDAYVTFSLKTGSRAKGEIWVRHTEWEGALIDLRESNHETPKLVVAGLRATGSNKTLGERWEEEEENLEETILTKGLRDVSRVRWASQKGGK